MKNVLKIYRGVKHHLVMQMLIVCIVLSIDNSYSQDKKSVPSRQSASEAFTSGNFEQAYKFSKTLHELYPRNMQYMAVYIKNLLLVKQYSEAESMINLSRKNSNNAYFQAQLSILNGIHVA